MAEIRYQRLTRARARSGFAIAFTSRSCLWLGPDHLLMIDTNGYSEAYKRFYFRDVQAFTIALTQRRMIWNWVLGICTAACLVSWGSAFWSTPNPRLWTIILAVGVTAIFAVPLAVNNLLGPTCTCHLRTAVQTEQLAPLNRLSRARSFIHRLRPFILSAQGGAAPQATASQTQPRTATATGPAPAPEPGATPDTSEAPPRTLP